ncbi:uncharacterized protein Gasu_47790 [Galdieria sulphuraria]|uniref:Uncharacterized protein n=2 Tax=Galdieria sulphuraria TaxID=130081 RepID=M2XW22_GALSU|nr:uncharacterized protein Gasu_47790 [Galdieria sulphuraria]EME27634.1 hypothetical protein Gasu_47790 [Galdieria sulphuraria]|eukprot:XP_005704154.1 hypothetical protein Gasu_47790 [Galdieria sulphuraria]
MAFLTSCSSLHGLSVGTRAAFCGSAVSYRIFSRTYGKWRMQQLGIFRQAMKDFASEYPDFVSRGLGVTSKAERWNGRHAMFGLLAIVLTGYAKGHGWIPNADQVLDMQQWGTLVMEGFNQKITNERAIVLVAHIHVLLVSIAAAIAPFSFQDRLLLRPGEKDEEPAGLLPPFKLGLTKEAELWNGRLAMLGVTFIVATSIITGQSILDVVNKGLGNILY